jgi:hypothetical protein
MTLALYTNGNPTSTRRRLTGTAHRGPCWVNAVHVLRAATQNALQHAGWRHSTTTNKDNSRALALFRKARGDLTCAPCSASR